ncbi:MAG: pentapeptide repeat-containing protein [Anaerolineae bacterium]
MPDRQLARLLRIILIAFIGVGAVMAVAAAFFSEDWLGLVMSLGTDMMGVGLTYMLLERILRRVEEAQEEKEARKRRKADLISDMGSRVHDVAIAATEELREEGWLTDGSLVGVILSQANLWDANLEEVYLGAANLEGVHLGDANLGGAHLRDANLKGANLEDANLGDANLEAANLQGAYLQGVKLNRETKITEEQLAQAETLLGAYCPLEEKETKWWLDAG